VNIHQARGLKASRSDHGCRVRFSECLLVPIASSSVAPLPQKSTSKQVDNTLICVSVIPTSSIVEISDRHRNGSGNSRRLKKDTTERAPQASFLAARRTGCSLNSGNILGQRPDRRDMSEQTADGSHISPNSDPPIEGLHLTRSEERARRLPTHAGTKTRAVKLTRVVCEALLCSSFESRGKRDRL